MENFTCTGGVRAGRGTSWASLQNLLIVEESAPGGPGQKLSYPAQERQAMGREGEGRAASAAALEQAGSAQPASSSSSGLQQLFPQNKHPQATHRPKPHQ